ncbi:Lysine-specific histone demethylase 1A [Dermatophagoides farinae]|uniref:Lysine-specific histone demethylase 1A n=1 Tax=Dermatophagoides farinae TaxID=6954 RepID=A0A922IGD6_DERFA|nr:Lysine-specific histone demethylase 1A [Dermatophagoides farinae]
MAKRKKNTVKYRFQSDDHCADNETNDTNVEESEKDLLIPTSYEEEFSNKSAAKESRLKQNRMTEIEENYFEDEDRNTYLNIRNAILRIWHNKPSVGLTAEIIKAKIKINDKKKLQLAEKIFRFLERYGYVNFGVFENTLPDKCVNIKNRERTVIVIGAGASGLAAARQLIYFGFNVIVLEASKRVGGRCYAFYKNEIFFDPGNILVNGIKGNPIRTVMKQLGLNAKQLKSKHKLYMDGELVDKKKDLVMHKIFLIFLRTLYFLAIENQITEFNNQTLSPENIFDVFIYFLETAATTKAKENCQKMLQLEENLGENLIPLVQEFEFFFRNIQFFRSFKFIKTTIQPRLEDQTNRQDNTDDDDDDDFDRTIVFDHTILNDGKLNNQCSFASILKSHMAFLECIIFNDIHKKISLKKNEVLNADKFKGCSEFFSLEDMRIFEWYFGTLEFFLGAPLSDYSLRKFAEDDFDHSNEQYVIPDGYMNFMQAMYSQGCSMKIWKRMRAEKIVIKSKGVEVLAIKQNEGSEMMRMTFKGDAVICTLPLGVLKKAIQDQKDAKFTNNIIFDPPLPQRKRQAIENLGIGTVNKVILGFDDDFWHCKDQFLGNVAMSRECRGEFLMSFFNSPTKNNNEIEIKTTTTATTTSSSSSSLDINKSNKGKKSIQMKQKPKQMYSVTSVLCGQSVETISHMNHLLNDNDNDETTATTTTNNEDVIIVSKCYSGLKEIFENIPQYTRALVTHWEREPFYLGTHSYQSIRSHTNDYDIIAEPVLAPFNHIPRLFFAGEHTSLEYPATVHGAFLSGLRAATEVANCFDPLMF